MFFLNKLKLEGLSATALLLLAGSAAAHDLYWTERKQIIASDIDGGNEIVIFDGELSSPAMESFVVDLQVTDDHLYWSGHNGGDIWRADRDGSNPVQLISGTGATIHFFDIDEENGKIYFGDFFTSVYQADLADGGNLEVAISDNSLDQITSVIIDKLASTADETAFLGVSSSGPYLLQMALASWGGYYAGYQDLKGGSDIYSIAHDPDTNIVYYTNFSDDTIRSINLDTMEDSLLWTPDMRSPLGVKLSPGGTHLLIAERGRGISGYEIETGGYELLADAPNAYFGVAVTADPGTLELPPPPPGPIEDGDILFQADFENDIVGELPLLESEGGVWRSFGAHGYQPDNFYVARDEENLFGRGTENKFLRLDNSVGSYLDGYLEEPWEVVTLSFETILRRITSDNPDPERFAFSFFGQTSRMGIFSLSDKGAVRGGSGRVPQFEKVRLDVIYNNSPNQITYEDHEGNQQTLDSYYIAVWSEGEKISDASHFGAQQTEGEVVYLRMPHFSSTDTYSMDVDNITIFAGASVLKSLLDEEPPSGEGFAGWQEEHFPGISDEEIIGPEADPDGDGIPNLLEYLLGSDPNTASRENLPQSAVEELTVEGAAGEYLTLTFTVSDEAADEVGYNVEVADELGNWAADAVEVDSVSNGDGTTTYTYRDSVAIDSENRRFMRLNTGG